MRIKLTLRKIRDHLHTVELNMRIKSVYVNCLDTTQAVAFGFHWAFHLLKNVVSQ